MCLAATRYRFGDFEFDVRDGTLVRHDVDGDAGTRLPPQPAKLLALLMKKRGDIATRDEIRRELWPDVQVDFDQNLHFCIRQIRSALGETASNPAYIETIPRRGYRLMVQLQTLSDPNADTAASTKARVSGRPVALAVLAALLLVAFFLRNQIGSDAARPAPAEGASPAGAVRIAVMPFAAPRGSGWTTDTRQIAETLVLELTNRCAESVVVIGPTTTEAYDSSPQILRKLIDDFSIDFVINARFTTRGGTAGLLAEYIRASDGAHVWVSFFGADTAPETIVQTILDNVSQRFMT